MSPNERISSIDIDKTIKYFHEKIAQYGNTARGMDYKDEKSQKIRFDQFYTLLKDSDNFSINDLGCGYGAFYSYLKEKKKNFIYFGYDLFDEVLDLARKEHSSNRKFNVYKSKKLKKRDFTVAGAIFNNILDNNKESWFAHILETIEDMNINSKRGFAFNMLTKYSDSEHMRDDLFYGDPLFFFDLCKKKYSRNVALLHDYGLYDFTIIVRK